MEDIVYKKESDNGFDDTIVSVLKAVEKKGWTVFGIYEVHKSLAAKGFSQEPLAIIEICSAKHANKLLSINRMVSLCMPCRINVIAAKGKTIIAAIKPTGVSAFFDGISEKDAKEIEDDLMGIIENAV